MQNYLESNNNKWFSINPLTTITTVSPAAIIDKLTRQQNTVIPQRAKEMNPLDIVMV